MPVRMGLDSRMFLTPDPILANPDTTCVILADFDFVLADASNSAIFELDVLSGGAPTAGRIELRKFVGGLLLPFAITATAADGTLAIALSDGDYELNLFELDGQPVAEGPFAVTVTGQVIAVDTVDLAGSPFTIDVGGVDVVSVAPNSGPIAGGTPIAIAGAGFQAGATVLIGGNPAVNVVVVDTNNITCDTPAGAAGFADVTVTNPDTTTGTLFGGFDYTP